MAQKYIDTSLTTVLNDGSSIANAWHSFFQVVTNTQVAGTYVAGDIINVRTHNGVADITETSITAITLAVVGTTANPVTLKFDNGVIWGTGGTFMYSVSGLKTSLTGARAGCLILLKYQILSMGLGINTLIQLTLIMLGY